MMTRAQRFAERLEEFWSRYEGEPVYMLEPSDPLYLLEVATQVIDQLQEQVNASGYLANSYQKLVDVHKAVLSGDVECEVAEDGNRVDAG